MALRKLTAKDVTFELSIEPEDIPVRGNAMASGDDEADRKVEDEIMDRLRRGDLWAWCMVIVTAKWQGYEGIDTLGGCSYQDEDQFTQPGGYYDDMKDRAIDHLNEVLAASYAQIAPLVYDEGDLEGDPEDQSEFYRFVRYATARGMTADDFPEKIRRSFLDLRPKDVLRGWSSEVHGPPHPNMRFAIVKAIRAWFTGESDDG